MFYRVGEDAGQRGRGYCMGRMNCTEENVETVCYLGVLLRHMALHEGGVVREWGPPTARK